MYIYIYICQPPRVQPVPAPVHAEDPDEAVRRVDEEGVAHVLRQQEGIINRTGRTEPTRLEALEVVLAAPLTTCRHKSADPSVVRPHFVPSD